MGPLVRQRRPSQDLCVYDAPSPKAIRKTAEPNELPPQVGVLEPYLYTREVV
jgi:hypothetical protein